MTLTIFDPRTGKLVSITVADRTTEKGGAANKKPAQAWSGPCGAEVVGNPAGARKGGPLDQAGRAWLTHR